MCVALRTQYEWISEGAAGNRSTALTKRLSGGGIRGLDEKVPHTRLLRYLR